jgi:hypothetical protein
MLERVKELFSLMLMAKLEKRKKVQAEISFGIT